jgi:hypothetical protein
VCFQTLSILHLLGSFGFLTIQQPVCAYNKAPVVFLKGNQSGVLRWPLCSHSLCKVDFFPTEGLIGIIGLHDQLIAWQCLKNVIGVHFPHPWLVQNLNKIRVAHDDQIVKSRGQTLIFVVANSFKIWLWMFSSRTCNLSMIFLYSGQSVLLHHHYGLVIVLSALSILWTELRV